MSSHLNAIGAQELQGNPLQSILDIAGGTTEILPLGFLGNAIFTGAAATLEIDSLLDLLVTIGGFQIGDQIYLPGVTATSAVVNSADQLVIKNGAAVVAALQLDGLYANISFVVAPDGTGISIVALPVPPTVAEYTSFKSDYDLIQGGFDIVDTAANISTAIPSLNDPHINNIRSTSGVVSSSTSIYDTYQSLLDKVVGGFDIVDTAANLSSDLDALTDARIKSIVVSDNQPLTVSASQVANDKSQLNKLVNADNSPYEVDVVDTAANIQANLNALQADVAHIGSITSSSGAVAASVGKFLADQSALDKIVGGFNVVGSLPQIIGNLSALNGDAHIQSLTAVKGSATLAGGETISAPSFTLKGAGATLAVAEDTSIQSLTLGAGANLKIASGDDLTLTGASDLYGSVSGPGELTTSGTLTVLPGAALSQGSWEIAGAGTVVRLAENLGYGGKLTQDAGTSVYLNSGVTLLLTGADSLAGGVAGAGKLALHGATALSGGYVLHGSTQLLNFGSVTQSGGAVTTGDSPGSKAEIVNRSGATWTITDTSRLAEGSSIGWRFVNNGLFQATGGSGVALVKANFYSNGAVSAATGGGLEFDAPKTSLSGALEGGGTIEYGPDTLATLGALAVTGSVGQTNLGLVVQTADMTVSDGSDLLNGAGGHWYLMNNASDLVGAGQAAGPEFVNKGAWVKSAGAGVSHIGLDVSSPGSIVVRDGILSFEGAFSAFSGAIGGQGVFEISAGQAEIDTGAKIGVAHWTLAGGTTTLDEDSGYGGAFTALEGATLDLNGHRLVLTGASSFSGLDVTGTGSLQVRGSADVADLTIGGKATFTDMHSVVQSGGDVTLGDRNLQDAASLIVRAGATWTIADASSILAGADALSTLHIQGSPTTPGLLEKTGAGVSTIATKIANGASDVTSGGGTTLGGVEVGAGVLDLQGSVVSRGSDNIVGAGELEFDNFVGPNQTVYFSGSGGSLLMTDFSGFYGKVSGFGTVGSNDALLIGGGWTLGGEHIGASAATLSFTDGSARHSLTLLGNYAGDTFAAQTTSGQLKITV